MATRKIKDAKDLSTNELIYFKGHAKATFMSDGKTVEDAINQIGTGGGGGITAEIDPIFSASPAASITEAKKTEWDGKYTKPSGGIPASDLAPDVFLQGEKGEKGDKGDTGATGPQGVSVTSVVQTTTSSADGGSNVMTVTLSNGTKSTFTVKNGSKGSQGEQGPKGDTGAEGPKGDKGDTGATGANGTNGKDGADGEDGATFTPSVDANGNLSWTNNKGLSNPPTVNIKGPKGDSGEGGGGGSGEDIRYFTEFTVERVKYCAAASAVIAYDMTGIIEAARNNRLICVPYADVEKGYTIASYKFIDGEEYLLEFSASIFDNGANYLMRAHWSGSEFRLIGNGENIYSTQYQEVEVVDGIAEFSMNDNSVYYVFDTVEYLCIYHEELVNGSIIRFMSGENTAIEFWGYWANGVIPTIEPYTAYEMSIASGADYTPCAVLTPFKAVE